MRLIAWAGLRVACKPTALPRPERQPQRVGTPTARPTSHLTHLTAAATAQQRLPLVPCTLVHILTRACLVWCCVVVGLRVSVALAWEAEALIRLGDYILDLTQLHNRPANTTISSPDRCIAA